MNRDKLRETLTGHLLALGFLNKVFYEEPAHTFLETIIAEGLLGAWSLPGNTENTRRGLALWPTSAP